jgi:hypothetical protein
MSKDSFYIVHTDNECIHDLEECWIVRVKDDNEEAKSNIDNGEPYSLLENADQKWDADDITLGS